MLENILNMFQEGIFWKDKDRRFLGANQMFLEYYGFDNVEQIIGKTDEDMGWHIDPEPFRKIEENILLTGKPYLDMSGECLVKGDLRKIRASKFPIKDGDEIIGLIGYFRDVTKEVAEKEKLFNLSYRDELTGLFNRRAYVEIIKQFETQYELTKQDFALYMIDLNDFKAINDTYGHEFGNLVLKATTNSIKNAVQETSVVFRYGGDEFVVVHKMRENESIDDLKFKLLQSIKAPKFIEGINVSVEASIGSEIYSRVHSIAQLTENADKQMYNMKAIKKKVVNDYPFAK